VIFTRHFWCLNCQAYVRGIGQTIPPQNLPEGTQIIFIGCGSYQAIDYYRSVTKSFYPVYANPNLELYKLFNFTHNIGEAKKGQEKDYMKNEGTYWSRVWKGIRVASSHLEHVNAVGPKSQNGGEVVISPEGKCEYIYRMQNTADHTNTSELAMVLGAKYSPAENGTAEDCGDSCEVGTQPPAVKA